MTADTTRTRLDGIRARLNAATPGPWKAEHRHVHASENDDEKGGLGWEIDGPPEPLLRGQFSRAADAHLIAHAPDDLAALLGVVDAAKAAMDHVRVDGSECSTEYVCDGDCDVALDLWERLDAALDELTKEKETG